MKAIPVIFHRANPGKEIHLNHLKTLPNIFSEEMFSFSNTAQKMKNSINDFFSKYDQIRKELRVWSHLLKKSLMKNLISCAVKL